MTREEKKNWLENASAEELIKQYKTSIRTYDKGDCFDKNNLEDIDLVEAELLRRLSR